MSLPINLNEFIDLSDTQLNSLGYQTLIDDSFSQSHNYSWEAGWSLLFGV